MTLGVAGVAEIWPESWLEPEAETLVLDFIEHLDVDVKVKKRTLHEWATKADVKLTNKMVEYVTKLPAGEI